MKIMLESTWKDWVAALVVVVAFFAIGFFCVDAKANKEAAKLGRYELVWVDEENEVKTMYFTPSSIDTDTRYQEFYADDNTTITVSRGVCCVKTENSELVFSFARL